ncbi:MAG: ABC transporter ATP-binding protein [Oscillospiraceae bacterium]|nr:ABC transporter ATP-binding protein [Oscillospiraceae bacterium]
MLEVKNLSFAYSKNGRRILDGVSFYLEQGQFMAILGNNGAGKSTLIKCIDRINPVTAGQVLVNGKSIEAIQRRQLAQSVAYVPQNTQPAHTMVFDAVLLGRKPYIKWGITAEDERIVAETLEMLNLKQLESRYLDELSGGELQKTMLARALVQQPKYLLLDEPTSSLDPNNQHEMLHVIRDIAQEKNIGVAIVIHDLNLAMRHCDRFLFIKDAKVFSFGGVETVTPETIETVYDLRVDIIEHKGIRVIVPY